MAKITKGKHHNIQCYILENQELQVKVNAEFGAKILSIYHKAQNVECLFQPSLNHYEIPKWGDSFATFDTSGLDDCIPTIDPCTYPKQDSTLLPDHGDVWAMPWEITVQGEEVICQVKLKSLPLLFVRKMKLEGGNLLMSYEVKNLREEPVAYLWALHGLNIYHEEAKVFFETALQTPMNVMGEEEYTYRPWDVEEKTKGEERNSPFEYPGQEVKRPQSTSLKRDYSFNWQSLREYPDEGAYKFYFAEKAKEGRCGIAYERQGLLYTIHFDPTQQPYVGMWFTKGSFKGEYNVALEPSNGFYDDLNRAIQNDKAAWIEGNAVQRWQIRIEVKKLMA